MNATVRSISLLALVLVTGACSSSAPTAPNPTTSTQTTNTSTFGASALVSADVPLFNVSDTASGRGACVFNPSTGQFVCPDQTHGGLTVSSRFTLFDAAGHVQSAFDRATTASIRTETSVNGTVTMAGGTMTVSRDGVMTVSGLGPAATTHTLNGTEQGTIASTMMVGGVTMTMTTSLADTTTNLVMPVGRDGQVYPLSGTRVHVATMTTTRGSETTTMTMRRQETYNGSSVVQVEMTMNGVTQHCTMDLAAHTSTCGGR